MYLKWTNVLKVSGRNFNNNVSVGCSCCRVNERDIQMDVKESLCESCGDLCGDEVDCRVWVYQGNEYTIPPKAMIIEALLKEVYGGSNDEQKAPEYFMPDNLKKFYDAMKNK
ncbi:DUF2703 domain-containing protein [Desulfosporosinus fructosivorans]